LFFVMLRILFLCLFVLGQATKTLVIIRDLIDKSIYSQFLRDLKNRGHELVFKVASDPSIALNHYGVFQYDNLILLSPQSKKLGELGGKSILKHVDSGRNVLIAFGDQTSKMLKNVASHLGVEFKPGKVKDHVFVNLNINDNQNRTHITTRAAFGHPVNGKLKNPIAYRGGAITFKSKTQFGYHLLSGEDSSYNKNLQGKEVGLVSVIQLRNNARVTFVGSLEMLSNKYGFMNVEVNGVKSGTDNRKFVNQMVSWAFKERGHIRTRDAKHYLLEEQDPTMNPNRYTIKQRVRYQVYIDEYDSETQDWKPYKADDVQFQLVRLDPFIRTTLQTDGDGLFYLEFTLPDHYGIFKFMVDYRRQGYTYLYAETMASVRPLRMDQHPRFLISAYPYYAAMISMMIGSFTFGFLFLYAKTPEMTKDVKVD